MIGTQVLVPWEAQAQSGTYGKIPLKQLLQNPDVSRANAGAYNRLTWTFDDAAYNCVEYGLEGVVDDRSATQNAGYFNAELVTADMVRKRVMRAAEARIAAAIFNTTTWTGSPLTTSISTEWSTAATAVPITDVKSAKRKVFDGCGMWPNALIISRSVFHNLQIVTQITDAIKSGGAGDRAMISDVTPRMIALALDLDYVIVGGAPYNSANIGQTATIAEIWDDEYAMVAKIALPGDPIEEPVIGRTIHWGADGSEIGGTVETYRDETVRAGIVRVRHDVDEVIMYPQCGHLLTNITA